MVDKKICSNCIDGKCSNCGECCIPWLPITYYEYVKIKKYIEKNDIKPQKLVNEDKHEVYFDCCFHDRQNHKCLIYDVRPKVCKNFMCCHSQERIAQDRKMFDKRAYFNGDHIRKFWPMDLLFYDDPTILMYFIQHQFNPKNIDQLKMVLEYLGHKDLCDKIVVSEVSKDEI